MLLATFPEVEWICDDCSQVSDQVPCPRENAGQHQQIERDYLPWRLRPGRQVSYEMWTLFGFHPRSGCSKAVLCKPDIMEQLQVTLNVKRHQSWPGCAYGADSQETVCVGVYWAKIFSCPLHNLHAGVRGAGAGKLSRLESKKVHPIS